MKKIVNIQIEIDCAHPAAQEWEKERDFISEEYCNVLKEQIYPFCTSTVPKCCKGESETEASKYKVRVINQE